MEPQSAQASALTVPRGGGFLFQAGSAKTAAAEPSSDTPVIMPPGAFSCLSGPSPSVHASSCKQPQPPSVPRWWGFPVLGRTTPGRRAKPHPLLRHQRLSAGKAAECRGFAVLTGQQQAQGKHGNECRGLQPEIVTNATAKPPHRNRGPVRKPQPGEATRAAMRGGVPWGETPRHPASRRRGRERRVISVAD
jgi:hypothetical protein